MFQKNRRGRAAAAALSFCVVSGIASAGLVVAGVGPCVPADASSSAPAAKGSVVKLIPDGKGGFSLQRDGKPYFIKGAGGSASLPALKEAGGNSIRTWGSDNLGPILDEAQKLGLSVCVGIWFGHKEHNFHYDDPKQVAEQQERVREAVQRYKDHPAVLAWALGNEMEGYAQGDDPLVWRAIQDAAKMVKSLDPNHPTMTVVAEIGGARVKSIHSLCPDIDIVGINSYGGGPSLASRYQAAGGTKPFVITEFGPAGTWESGKTPWGAVPELTSTDKAAAYRRTYEGAIAKQPLCLGSYAFTWGNKQEATATWYGMFLPDGSKLAAVDAMTELWSGKPPAQRCPEIKSLRVDGPDQIAPGASVQAVLNANDPEGHPLKVEWVLQKDPMDESLGGATQAVPPTYPDALVQSDTKSVKVKMPDTPGAYRLFAYVRDDEKGAAVGNIPLFVKAASAAPAGEKAAQQKPLKRPSLPLSVYPEPENNTYIASGWMGNAQAVKMDNGSTERPHSGGTCLKVQYTDSGDWAGVVWQSPAGDWGEKPGGLDLTGAKRLTFWARGDKGGEVVSFQFGLLGKDKAFSDSASGKSEQIALTPEWKQYSIDLSNKDLSRIKTSFCWVVAGQGKPVTFYLDDIRYE